MKRAVLSIVILVLGLWVGASWASAQTSFRFVAWSDSQGSSGSNVNTAILSALSNQANELSPTFTILSGDLCNSWGSTCTSTGSSGWKYALNNGSPGNGMFDKTFVWRGNHDNSASGWDSYFNGHAQATVTAIGGTNFSYYATDGANRTYSFDYGNSHIVGIDMPGGDISSMTSGQISWLDTDITNAESRGVTHTFIIDHGPIYYVDGHASTAPSSLITVMNKHPSISASFHGHEHLLAYVHVDSSRISGVTHPWEEFVSGGAGGGLYACAVGRSDYCTFTHGFVSVDVDGNTFTVNLYLLGGGPGPAETWTFTKSTPAVTLTPATASFGNQSLGATSAAQALTLTNGTASSVSISSIAVTGTNSGDFAQTNGCGSSLAAGASCTINVTFTPTATGTRTASLAVTDSATGSPHTAALTGTGVTNTASVSPTSLTFGNQAVGTTSTAQSSTLTNTGTISLTIASIAVSGDFAETDNCGNSVAAGGSCTINVTFTPTATGTRTGTLTITDDAPDSPQMVSLTGTGIQPSIAIGSVSPGVVTLAQGGSSQSVTVNLTRTNYTGSVTLATSTLPSGVTATYTQPGTGNAGSITLQAASDAALVSNQTITITASGSGVSSVTSTFSLTVSPTPSIVIGSVSPGVVTLVQGGSAQSVTVNLTRTNYTGSVTLATSTLPSGVTATYTQPGTGNAGSITLQAASDAALVSNQTITITASGSGVSSVTSTFSLTVSPTPSIVIGSVSPGVVTLVQGGSAQSVTVNLTRTNYTGSVTLATSTLPSGVTATYTQPGTGNAGSITLQAASDAALVSNQTITITASGSGVSSATSSFSLTVNAGQGISVSPANLDFANQGVGTTSGAQTVTLTNTGTATVTISSITASGISRRPTTVGAA